MAEQNTVTLTLGELNEKMGSLNALLQSKLPIRASYRISKLSKKIAAEQKHLIDARNDLVKKHGEEDERGNYSVQPSAIKAFTQEWDALMKETVEFPIMKVTLEEIKDAQLMVGDVANLDFLIEEDAPQAEKK